MSTLRGTVTKPVPQGVSAPHAASTLREFNRLVGLKAHFSYDDTDSLVVNFPSLVDGENWCQFMNIHVFPMEQGAILGSDEDSAVQQMGVVFRFPMNLYHVAIYIGEGTCFYRDGEWDCLPEKKRVGRFDPRHGREQFMAWFKRQIATLESFSAFLGSQEERDHMEGPEIVD